MLVRSILNQNVVFIICTSSDGYDAPWLWAWLQYFLFFVSGDADDEMKSVWLVPLIFGIGVYLFSYK